MSDLPAPAPASSQKSDADLTPAQKRRKLAVASFLAASQATAARELAQKTALDAKLAMLSPSQLSLYTAGLYKLPADPPPTPAPAPAAPAGQPKHQQPSTSTSTLARPTPNITPASSSFAWADPAGLPGSSSQPIDLSSPPPASRPPANSPRASKLPSARTGFGPSATGNAALVEMDKRQAARKRARAKVQRGGFDTDSSEDNDGAEVKPVIQGRTQRALPSRPPKPDPVAAAAKEAAAAGPAVELSAEQERVRELVVNDGVSLFFTGSAGTGKSVLLRELIAALRKKYRDPTAVGVTASTGIAACNIGGSTVHSFAGIGLGLEDVSRLAGKCRGRKDVLRRWKETKVWIIDELSMLDGALFDKLAALGSVLRNDDRPFGGIQMVLCGDFLQLPPVTESGREPVFAFDARCWQAVVSRRINLTEVFRQKDQRFVDMLNEVRFGSLSARTVEAFAGMSRAVKYEDGLEPTELFSHRAQVETANLARLRVLEGEARTFDAFDSGKLGPEARTKVLNNMMAPQTLSLKVGAQVMLIKNKTTELVNGSIGTVLAFTDRRTYLDAVYGSLALAPPDELAGLGVSRRQALEDLDEDGWWGDEDGEGFLKVQSGGERFPLVRFAVPGGGSREVLIERDEFKVETPDGETAACRRQVPLILAWAMSIHKSQGQTLQRMKCDLGKVFEKGQAYVALSRATSLDALQILNFRADKVMSHPRVAEWNTRNLETLDVVRKPKPKPKPEVAPAATDEPPKEEDEDEVQILD